jgi:hypothetical protein
MRLMTCLSGAGSASSIESTTFYRNFEFRPDEQLFYGLIRDRIKWTRFCISRRNRVSWKSQGYIVHSDS